MDLFAKILAESSAYFTEGEVSAIVGELEVWPVSDDCVFYQVAQEENEPKLEIAYRSVNVLIDYTYRRSKKELVIITISSISNILLRDTNTATSLQVRGGGITGLTYAATVDNFRQSLRVYAHKLQKIIFKLENNA